MNNKHNKDSERSMLSVTLQQIGNNPTCETSTIAKNTSQKPPTKHPLIYRRNVVKALNQLERMALYFGVQDDVIVLLKAYRDHMEIFGRAVSGPPPIHSELVQFVKNLDDAFNAIHNYVPEDHFTEGTYRLGQSRTGGIGKLPAEEIEEKLIELGIQDPKKHGKTKGDIKKQVINFFDHRFSVSERTLDKYIKKINQKENS